MCGQRDIGGNEHSRSMWATSERAEADKQNRAPSGQSTTVTYTYEFIDTKPSSPKEDPWARLRGALRDVFAELGGGEQYLRAERDNFYGSRQSK